MDSEMADRHHWAGALGKRDPSKYMVNTREETKLLTTNNPRLIQY